MKHEINLTCNADGATIERYKTLKKEMSNTAPFLQRLETACKIADECEPSEVYAYEHGLITPGSNADADVEAICRIIDIWGYEVAQTVQRINPSLSIEQIINMYYLTKRN